MTIQITDNQRNALSRNENGPSSNMAQMKIPTMKNGCNNEDDLPLPPKDPRMSPIYKSRSTCDVGRLHQRIRLVSLEYTCERTWPHLEISSDFYTEIGKNWSRNGENSRIPVSMTLFSGFHGSDLKNRFLTPEENSTTRISVE
ncbi:hypothetical protein F5146DRAFT_1009819 [Armillaria mellea]|nr:hypothetical protein F5146DRAFT_1009819 [Armillaria mellea]